MRGLRGTPQAGSGYFYPLVAVYATALTLFMRRSLFGPMAPAQSHAPMPLDTE
jgi:hypothetical protein